MKAEKLVYSVLKEASSPFTQQQKLTGSQISINFVEMKKFELSKQDYTYYK